MQCSQLPFIRVEEAVSWTQRFLTRNILPKKQSLFDKKKMKANVCRNSTFQVNRTKNGTGKRRLTSSNRAAMSALHRKNDKTNLFGYKLGELTENNKALRFFSWSLEVFQGVPDLKWRKLKNIYSVIWLREVSNRCHFSLDWIFKLSELQPKSAWLRLTYQLK